MSRWLLWVACGCAARRGAEPAVAQEDWVGTRVGRGDLLLREGSPQRALDEALLPAVARCAADFPDRGTRVFATRGPEETLMSLVTAAAAPGASDAEVIFTQCDTASFLTAYAYVELEQWASAEAAILDALRWAPYRAPYHSELGHIYQMQGRWGDALAAFTRAEEAAAFSPESVRDRDLARAKRGMGFQLIELRRLDEARAKFQECLQINPKDEGALQELAYIDGL